MIPSVPPHLPPDDEGVDFGHLSDAVNALLQQGVLAYRTDYSAADRLFRTALARAPHELPVYFCLYKIHTYRGRLEDARHAAEAGLAEAARQAGWSGHWREWPPCAAAISGPGRFALYTLKALAFIHLRRAEPTLAGEMLARLAMLDPSGATGWPVVADLAAGVQAT